MTHDSRRTRFPLLARPVSDASVRAVIPLARNISAIDNKVNLFLLGAPTARERLGTPSREKEGDGKRSEEHTSELQSLMRISYAVFCLKKKNNKFSTTILTTTIESLQSNTQYTSPSNKP